MKFAVGYQLSEEGDEPFINIVRDFKESIEEVYFPCPDMPSGRMPLGNIRGVIDWESQKKLEKVGLDIVTTTSLTIAKAVKDNFSDIEVRASVNMRLGTVKSLEYIEDLFDSFYLQREYNRDFERIREMKRWCDLHNKGLYMLVNSGCLNFCSAQTFHDNLIATRRR